MSIYPFIESYFSDLIFTRLDSRDGFTMYVARLGDMMSHGERYVMLFVPMMEAKQKSGRIKEIPWVNFQTRLLTQFEDGRVLSRQIFKPPRISNQKEILLKIVERTKAHTKYLSPSGETITLLHDPRKKTMYQYHNSIALSSALDTFQFSVNRCNEDICPTDDILELVS